MKLDIKEFIAIGDQAGRYDEMIQLITQLKSTLSLPEDIHIISLGDPNDRGKDSKKVIEFFMEDQKNRTMVQSNHLHMMVDFWENNGCYSDFIFLANGGIETAKSYGVNVPKEFESNLGYIFAGYQTPQMIEKTRNQLEDIRIEFIKKVPKEHIEFAKSCPLSIETDEVVMTHAPINPTLPIPKDDDDDLWFSQSSRAVNFLWNRGKTRRRDKFQLHGHNAFEKSQFLKDKEGLYGINLDTSRGELLSGLHWPSQFIVSIPYIK